MNITGTSGADGLIGTSSADTINGLAGNDTMIGGLGDDFYFVDSAGDVVIENANEGIDTIRTSVRYTNSLANNVENLILETDYGKNGSGNSLNNDITGNPYDNTLEGFDGNDTLRGKEGSDYLIGDAGNDSLSGGDGNDTLLGYADNDILDGGTGNDRMLGGTGNDTYLVDSSGDQVVEDANAGIDTVEESIATYYLGDNVEKLTMKESTAINGYGNSLDNVITGSIANNFISAGDGNDYIDGKEGNDYLLGGSGNDTIFAGIGNDSLYGDAGNDNLSGDAGNDSLSGYTGNDVLNGGAGDDIYTFALGDGVDEITDTAGADVLKFDYTVSKNDLYYLQSGNNLLVRNRTNSDKITMNNWYSSTANRIETMTFYDGTSIAINPTNSPINQAVNEDTSLILDVLDGYAGQLTVSAVTQGQNGVVSINSENKVVYTPSANYNGADIFTYTLNDGNGGVTTKTINLTINPINDAPTAALVSGTLDEDGSVVLDILSNSIDVDGDLLSINSYTNGQNGYVAVVDNKLVYTPNTNYNGTDAFTYTLSDGNGGIVTKTVDLTINPVNDAPTATLVSGTLTEYSSLILDALASASDIEGDTLTIDSFTQGANGAVTLNAENKLVYTSNKDYSESDSFNYTISDGNGGTVTKTVDLTITPLPTNITGGSGNDVLTGNYRNNYIDGGLGADTMAGGLGNDTYYVDNTGDVVTEASGAGNDTVNSSITYTLGTNIENLTLTGTSAINGTGNSLDNVITGNVGNNIITGGAGADTMIGGVGNDTYYIDNIGDVTIENANEGTDGVYSSFDYTLGANVENLVLTWGANANATGNELNNTIYGNTGNNVITSYAGNDILVGGAGADTMIGGVGNDNYYIDNVGDVIIENMGEGSDWVSSSISYTLGDNVEKLTLTGTSDINTTGNDLNNVLAGNAGNNILNGGAGNDTLNGGAGDDTYSFSLSNGNDTISDSAGNDKISFGATVSKNNVAVFMSGTDLVVDYGTTIGTDKIVVLGQTTSSTAVEKLQLSDGTYVSNTDVNQLIQTMTAYASENNIQLTSVSDVRNNQDLMTMVANSWHS